MTTRIDQLLRLTQGERLARARKVAGMSQDDIAERLGRDVRTIGRWERDQSPVSREAVIAWATITEAPLEWLVSGGITDGVIDGEDHMAPVYIMPALFSADDFLIAA